MRAMNVAVLGEVGKATGPPTRGVKPVPGVRPVRGVIPERGVRPVRKLVESNEICWSWSLCCWGAVSIAGDKGPERRELTEFGLQPHEYEWSAGEEMEARGGRTGREGDLVRGWSSSEEREWRELGRSC